MGSGGAQGVSRSDNVQFVVNTEAKYRLNKFAMSVGLSAVIRDLDGF